MRSAILLGSGLAAAALVASSLGCSVTVRQFGGDGGSGGGVSSSSSASSSSSSASSSSSSASSSSSSSASSSSSSSSSNGGPVESDCTNGIDDDGDTLVDCEDPDCTGAGYTCAAEVPAGWQGPAVLYADKPAPPDCGSAWALPLLNGGLDIAADPASCSACGCKAPIGQACDGALKVTLAADSNCLNGQTQTVPLGACIGGPGTTAKAVQAFPVAALGGSCAAVGGLPSLPPADFGTRAAVCGLADATTVGKGCDAGACVPKPPPGYGASVCIAADGDVACPSGPYQNRTVIYASIKDKRGCSACSCGAPAGGTCPTVADVYSSPFQACSNLNGTIPADGSCIPFGTSSPSARFLLASSTPSGGSCVPSGGLPTGSATGSLPTTVCCQ